MRDTTEIQKMIIQIMDRKQKSANQLSMYDKGWFAALNWILVGGEKK